MGRIDKAIELINQNSLDAFLFSSQANVFYLSGFKSTHAYIVLGKDIRTLLTDGRYYERAKNSLKNWEVVLIEGRAIPFLKKFIRSKGLKVVGFESDRVTCEFRRALRSSKIKWKGFSGFLDRIRMLKDPSEIKTMREGVKVSDKVYREVLNEIKPGMSEIEVRGLIVSKFFREGAQGESFPTIVASGPGSAVPHWESSSQKLKEGSALLIDMGLLWNGYCTDFTRTLFLGKPSGEFRKVYEIVRTAHLKALEKVKVGNKIGDVDREAREYIKSKGYGKFFVHSTGHGVGVEIHEYPRVYYKGPDADTVIEEGMVFTIEPGIYLPGEFGVRLENIIVVEKGSGEPMSQVSLELVTL